MRIYLLLDKLTLRAIPLKASNEIAEAAENQISFEDAIIISADFPMPNLAFWINECTALINNPATTKEEALELLADLSFSLDGYIKSTMQEKEKIQ